MSPPPSPSMYLWTIPLQTCMSLGFPASCTYHLMARGLVRHSIWLELHSTVWLPWASSLRAPAHMSKPFEGLFPNSVLLPSVPLSTPEAGLGNLWLRRELLAPPCFHTQHSLYTISTHTVKITHFMSLWVCLQCPFPEAFLSPPTNEASIVHKDLLQLSNSPQGGSGRDWDESDTVMAGWPIRQSEPA